MDTLTALARRLHPVLGWVEHVQFTARLHSRPTYDADLPGRTRVSALRRGPGETTWGGIPPRPPRVSILSLLTSHFSLPQRCNMQRWGLQWAACRTRVPRVAEPSDAP